MNTDCDLDTLTYVDKVPQSLICPVCKSVLLTPLQTKCQHIFCARCVSRALADKLECPIDRTAMPNGMEDCQAAPRLLDQLIDELEVKCPNSGCARTMERGLLHWHLKDACEYQKVKCRDQNCEKLSLRKDLGDGCEHQVVTCDHCDAELEVGTLSKHLDECPELSHVCPYCFVELSVDDIKQHKAACTMAPASCPAKPFGCMWSGVARDKAAHATACAIVIMMPFLQKQQDKLVDLELRNAMLQTSLETLQAAAKEEPVFEISSEYERDRSYLFQTLENLSNHVESLSSSITALDTKQSHIMMNETIRTKDELGMLRGGLQGLRLQVHHLVQYSRGPALNVPVKQDAETSPRILPTRQMSDGSRVKL